MYMYFPLQNQSQEDACELPEDSVSSRLTLQCRLLITIVNILDPDQARQNVGPVLDPNCLLLRW